MNDLQVTYQKERREFGKQCLFSDRKFLMVSMPSNHDEFDDYILRNPVSQGTQLGKQYSLSEVNRCWMMMMMVGKWNNKFHHFSPSLNLIFPTRSFSPTNYISFHISLRLLSNTQKKTEGQHRVDNAGWERRASLRRWLAKGCQLSGSWTNTPISAEDRKGRSLYDSNTENGRSELRHFGPNEEKKPNELLI